MKQLTLKLFLAAAVFLVSAAVSWYPIHQKGYASYSEYLNLIEARNDGLANTLQYQSNNGVFLSSTDAAQSVPTAMPNALTPIIYGKLFKYFGFHPLLPTYLAIGLFALANTFFFLIWASLIPLLAALIAGFVSSLIPIMIFGATSGGFYEFGFLFFIMAIGIYLISNKNQKTHSFYYWLPIAGIFFALAALARNALAITFVAFWLYDVYTYRSWRRGLWLLLPFLLIFGITLTRFSWLPVPNGYTAKIDQPFELVGHVFNDPYTYYYDRDQFIKTALADPTFLDRPAVEFLSHWGYTISLKQKISAYWDAGEFYLFGLFDPNITGGPVIWLFVIMGAIWLYRNNRRMAMLFGIWFATWLIYLTWSQTGNNDHFIELVPMIAVLVALGVVEIARLISPVKQQFISIGVIVLLLAGHLAYADRTMLSESYRSSFAGRTQTILQQFSASSFSKTTGVVAVGLHPDAAYGFAYYSNINTIYFHPDTISNLIAENKLSAAFQLYHVTVAIGYSPDLSRAIQSQTGIPTIPLAAQTQ